MPSIETLELWLAYFAAIVLIVTPFLPPAQKWADARLADAVRTPTPYDDVIARAFVRFLNGVAWLITIFPRLRTGLGDVRRVRDAIQQIPRPPRGGTTLLVFLIVAPFLGACGGTQMSRARTVLAVSGQAVVAVEQIFVPRYTAATEQAREDSETFEEYSEAVRRWEAGANSILLAATALHVAEGTLDAIDEGLAGDIAGVLACAGVALVDVVVALDGLVAIPDALRTAVTLVGALAGPLCDPPDPEAGALAVAP